jgi:hypothetical protein
MDLPEASARGRRPQPAAKWAADGTWKTVLTALLAGRYRKGAPERAVAAHGRCRPLASVITSGQAGRRTPPRRHPSGQQSDPKETA